MTAYPQYDNPRDTMEPINNPFLEAVRSAFRATGKSINRLSVESGVPYAAAHGVVNGTRDPTSTTLYKRCRTLGLDLRPTRKAKRKG